MHYKNFSASTFNAPIVTGIKQLDYEIQNELIDYVYKMRDKDPVGNTISNRRGWQSSPFEIVNEDDVLQSFLINCLSEFPPIKKSVKLFATAWININPPNAFNMKHNPAYRILLLIDYIKDYLSILNS